MRRQETSHKRKFAGVSADAAALYWGKGRLVRGISRDLGLSSESLRLWVNEGLDAGDQPGLTTRNVTTVPAAPGGACVV